MRSRKAPARGHRIDYSQRRGRRRAFVDVGQRSRARLAPSPARPGDGRYRPGRRSATAGHAEKRPQDCMVWFRKYCLAESSTDGPDASFGSTFRLGHWAGSERACRWSTMARGRIIGPRLDPSSGRPSAFHLVFTVIASFHDTNSLHGLQHREPRGRCRRGCDGCAGTYSAAIRGRFFDGGWSRQGQKHNRRARSRQPRREQLQWMPDLTTRSAAAGVIRSQPLTTTVELGWEPQSTEGSEMALFVGLDVSLRTISVCIVEAVSG
jgi:hypothetical protein